MQIDFEKMLVHANERLADISLATERQQQAEAFKKFLKIETERLRIRHRFGLGGVEIARGRSYLIDMVVCRACQLAAADLHASEAELNHYTVVALGGYGRRELSPFSDVDLLFLHAGSRTSEAKRFVEHTLYLLWDMGLTVGHSFRSPKECVAMARTDLVSRNAMSEARHLTGNPELFRRFTRQLDDAIFRSRRETDSFLEAMMAERRARYEKFGKPVCVQEPNVKESAGGLRDLHTALWVGHARYQLNHLDDLRAADHLSGAEYAAARRAYDFIVRVRNEAHFLTGRKTDLLTLDLQPQVAASFGYQAKRGLEASELFMREYYQRARELNDFAESFIARALAPPAEKRNLVKRVTASFESRQGQLFLTITRGAQASGKATGYEIKQGKLYLKEEPSDFRSNAMHLLELFSVAQSERVGLSEELKATIRSQLHLVTRRFRDSKEASRAFLDLLNRKGRVAAVLRMMHETGFLGKLMPEFARITFLVQHDFYHKYTIDEHTLKAIEALDRLSDECDPRLLRLVKVFGEIETAAPLYLGLLLHDIGKGHGGGHVQKGTRIAERVCERLRLDDESAAQVRFLVKEHLLMSHTSQRRDLSEEGLIESFVARVTSLNNLNKLLLLTYGDISGVGPGVWTDWKATLLWELYARARTHFVEENAARYERDRRMLFKQQVIRELAPEFPPSGIERHFAMMPDRYQRANKPSQIARHLRLARRLDTESLATDWQVAPNEHCTNLSVCARDRAGLFARIAGTLTAHGINILSADLNTREDGLVIDTFKVCEVQTAQPVRADLHGKVEKNLQAALAGSYDVAAAVAQQLARGPRRTWRKTARKPVRPSVRFDTEASALSTVIEVRADDQPGLAYRIASAIAGLDFNITFAKISTEKSHALDVFYVTDARGQKLDAAAMQAVEQALVGALGNEPTDQPMKEAV
ncbi:MAG: [protein-PII] uridylyltransferase [Blastocatellia bacterium]